MSESETTEEIDLTVLAERLLLEGMPAQMVIAREAGVSQPTVSRAVRGQIKGVSKAARKLWKYASERMGVLREAQAESDVAQMVQRPSSQISGRPGEVRAASTVRKRAAPLPRHRLESSDVRRSGNRQQLAEAAMAGLRDYLDDAFDPLLVIEQLAVLRRAQDPARRRDKGEPADGMAE